MLHGETRVVGKTVEFHGPKRKRFIEGQMILRIRGDAVPAPRRAGTRMTVAAVDEAIPDAISAPLEYLRKNAGLKRVTPIFSTQAEQVASAGVRGGAQAKLAVFSSVAHGTHKELAGINVLELDPKKVTPALMRRLKSSRAIEIAEPMPARWLQKPTLAADPMTNKQWGLRAIDWFGAVLPTNGVVIGVLDTGVDMTHPDLKGVVTAYHHDGVSARDLVGHGTHVSGIIGAKANNGIGIAGVAAGCHLIVWKIFGDEPDPTDGEFYVDGTLFLRALGAARDAGVHAINLSIGGTESSQTEQLLFQRLEAAGVVVAAAMGNEYQDGNPTEYPAAYKGVLAVGAVAETLRRSVFSNTGKHIGLVAPGSNILSTLPLKAAPPELTETEYASWSGTSMATPHVTATAGLVAAKNPGWDAVKIKQHLVDTAQKVAGMGKKSWTSAYGAGLLDVKAAL